MSQQLDDHVHVEVTGEGFALQWRRSPWDVPSTEIVLSEETYRALRAYCDHILTIPLADECACPMCWYDGKQATEPMPEPPHVTRAVEETRRLLGDSC